MPGGVRSVHIPHRPLLLLCLLFREKSAFANPLFSTRCALFQVPYPVSPLFASLTKTAGCIPTIPISEPASLLRASSGPHRLCVSSHGSLVTLFISPVTCPEDLHPPYYWS